MLSLLAVFVGGIVGTALRFGLDLAMPHGVAQPGWSTIIVNVVGSFALGLLAGTLWQRPSTPAWLKAGLGAGVLGSFTTFSAVTVSVAIAGMSGSIEAAIIDLGFSLVLGLIAALLGLLTGSKFSNPPREQTVFPDEGIDL